MPKLSRRLPQIRLHKPSGQARIRIDRRDIDLGKFGSAEAKVCYDRVVAEWFGNHRQLPSQPTIEEPRATVGVPTISLVCQSRNPPGLTMT